MSEPNQTLTPHMQMVTTLQECLNKASRLGISLLAHIEVLKDCDAIKAHMMEYKEDGLKVTENLFQHLARDTEYDRISCIFSIACNLGYITADNTSPIAAYKKSNRGNMENQVMIFLGKVANGEYPMETISYKECVNLPGGKFITLQNQVIMIHIPTGTKIIIDCKPTHTINGKSPIRTFYQMENLQRVEADFKKGRMPKGDLSLYDFLHAKADGHIISRLVSNNSENGFKDQYSAIVSQPKLKKDPILPKLKKTVIVSKVRASSPAKQGEEKLWTDIDVTVNSQNRTQADSDILDLDQNPKVHTAEYVMELKNKLNLPSHFKWIRPFVNGTAIVSDGSKYGLINKFGQEIAPFNYHNRDIQQIADSGFVRLADHWYLTNSNGDLIKKLNQNYQLQESLGDGFVSVKFKDNFGVMDEMGDLKTPFQYTDVRKFTKGLVAVLLHNEDCYGELDDDNSG
jgi:WG containing repeat